MRPLFQPRPSLHLLLRRVFSTAASCGPPRLGAVYSFGDNSLGAVGQAAPLADAYVPTAVASLPPTAAAVAAGHYHSLAISGAGEVWAWGRNEEGQLGRGLHAPRNTWSNPEQVRGLDHVQVRAASASGVISAAIGCDGSLWVWGRSKRGQLGLGKDVIEAAVPSQVEALAGLDVVKVSFGWGHAMALCKDGKLFGWGYSEDGRLGQMGQNSYAPSVGELTDKTVEYSTSMLEAVDKLVAERIRREDNMPIIWEPSLIHEVSDLEVSDVSCGLDHSLILCSNGVLLSGGDNTYGQLGRKTGGSNLLPVDIGYTPLSLSASVSHSLSLCQITPQDADDAGTGVGVVSWGWNRSFQLGRQGQDDVPALVEGLWGEKPISVSAGRAHSIVLTSRGEVWAWGSGRNGRLGLGSSMDEAEPSLIDSLEGVEVLQAVAGMDHNLLLVAE